MISYTLAASVPLEGHAWFLAATPGDGACAALADLESLAIVSGISHDAVERGGLNTNRMAGLGVSMMTGEIYVSLPSAGGRPSSGIIAILPAVDDGSREDIQCGFWPGVICVPPAGPDMYLAIDSDNGMGIAVLDTIGKSVTVLAYFDPQLTFGELSQVVADPNGGRLFVRDAFAMLYEVDLATQGIRVLPDLSLYIAIGPDGSCLYRFSAAGIDVVSTATFNVLRSFGIAGIDLNGDSAMAVSPDGVHLYITGTVPVPGPIGQEVALQVTETATGQAVTSMKLGGSYSYGPIVVSPDGSLIFIPTENPETIAVVRRTEAIRFLDVKVTIGSAPAWLVSRYAVTCTYTTPSGDHPCASEVLGADGGTISGVISDDGGRFPATVNVAVAIDFVPGTGLAGVVRNFTPAVTDVGVNFLFEPDQMMQTVELIFDLASPPPQPGDFLSVQWQHHVDGGTAGTGTKLLSGQDLAMGPVIQTDITFMPAAAPGTLAVTIKGRYDGAVLVTYSASFDVANTAVVLRPQPAAGGGYTLAVAR